MNEKPGYWQKRQIEHVKNFVAKAIDEFSLLQDGDRVLAAISGGKDSLVMLDALAEYRKFNRVSFHLEAIHIEVEDVPYQVDKNWLTEWTGQLQVPLHFVTVRAHIEDRGKKAPCFVCSWHRRKTLFEFAKDNNFQKLALGHHRDDAVETLLINMAYHGHISSLPAKLRMFNGRMELIRPLLLLTDNDTRQYAAIKQFPTLINECPYADQTKRTTARQLLQSLREIHPKADANIFHAMQNIDTEYLPQKVNKKDE
ncbi:tRNA 2-thiocytidine biosynthesis TtcA family protein [Candidatus Sulfidibacterium hydrothermale]|uniref:tRNA lysidine(34) synthetase n=1 Tax=Candidatus Sulfidibacterium hydrothermale TaxID=2875962 RepID=UPI001F0A1A49|nr:tRNA 2-thiocytidine biosynthesis TtcA family protein [Candidatus Sulfidibacterium hydrothermale]UBM63479.1 tRNA 2-thiocytidine biosynthesis TtcA family protein [Candidatus Sulfidibacterium hydrothermale]